MCCRWLSCLLACLLAACLLLACLLACLLGSTVYVFVILPHQAATLRASEGKLIEVITSADAESMPPLLELNDTVQAALTEHDFVLKHGPRAREAGPAPPSTPSLPTASGGSSVSSAKPKASAQQSKSPLHADIKMRMFSLPLVSRWFPSPLFLPFCSWSSLLAFSKSCEATRCVRCSFLNMHCRL
jgi:hypothetical protein